MHLPAQLARVDPIVASFCGGAVGVVSALLVVEVGNVQRQQVSVVCCVCYVLFVCLCVCSCVCVYNKTQPTTKQTEQRLLN
jgi:nitrate/nitrite transporter NarK